VKVEWIEWTIIFMHFDEITTLWLIEAHWTKILSKCLKVMLDFKISLHKSLL
jgi:hypothetical protein